MQVGDHSRKSDDESGHIDHGSGQNKLGVLSGQAGDR